MVIHGYELTVVDDRGTPVRSIGDEANVPGFWKRLFTSLGLSKKNGVAVPEAILWDGRSDRGEFVEDGEYTVTLRAWDDKKRTVTGPPIVV